ncbi:MAG: FAD-binding oxidoreductase [Gammaproteobacteria bacterium]|nr:FAD-binding oxidoreductase [Gammaproteobacteria bacterium]
MNDQRPAHIDSYYAATANAHPVHPCLEGEQCAEVAVIGGGLAGLSAALNLAERGHSVILLEGARVGWGASGRSGGQILTGYACDMRKLEGYLGLADAQKLFALSREAMGIVRQRVLRHGMDCELQMGYVHAAIKPRHLQELEEYREHLERHYGYGGQELWDRERLREVVDSPRYRGGLWDPHSGHLHPLNYTLGLAEAAARAGVRIYENSRVLRLERGAAPVLHTAAGRVRCQTVVVCGNAYIDGLVPELWRRIMPVGTYIAATEPLGEARAASLIRNNAAVCDTNFVLDYFRLSADHRLLFGGRVSYSTFDPPRLKESLRRRMLAVYPQLADVRMDWCWGGFVDITMNRAPHFGRLDGNLYFAQGFSGHGMALTGLAGQLIAEAVHGDASRLDLFAKIPHRPFPGGRWLRTPALVLAMAWFRLRDLL